MIEVEHEAIQPLQKLPKIPKDLERIKISTKRQLEDPSKEVLDIGSVQNGTGSAVVVGYMRGLILPDDKTR